MNTDIRVRIDSRTTLTAQPGYVHGAGSVSVPPHVLFRGPGVDLTVAADPADLRRIRDVIDTLLTEGGPS